MAKGDYNDGWTRKKNLGYDLGCDLLAVVTMLDYISEKDRPQKAERQFDTCLKVSKHAMKICQELYSIICTEDRMRKLALKN